MTTDPVGAYNPERSDMAKKNAAAQALGRRGGQANTKAQNLARQQNGQLGGRPSRVCVDCGEPVLPGKRAPGGIRGHKETALDTTCHTTGWKWAKRSA
jgi:hypothetical protein